MKKKISSKQQRILVELDLFKFAEKQYTFY